MKMIQCLPEPNFNWLELIRRILTFEITSKMSQWEGPPSQESILYQHFFPPLEYLNWIFYIEYQMLDPVWGHTPHVLWPFLPRVVTRAASEIPTFIPHIWGLGASLLWMMITAQHWHPPCDCSDMSVLPLTHVLGQNVKSICQAAPLAIVWFHQNILKIQKQICAGQRTGFSNMILQTWRLLVSRKISSEMVFRSYK